MGGGVDEILLHTNVYGILISGIKILESNQNPKIAVSYYLSQPNNKTGNFVQQKSIIILKIGYISSSCDYSEI